MTGSFDDLIAGATLPETTVELCLSGRLQTQWEDMEAALADAVAADQPDGSLAGTSSTVRKLAEELRALEEEMAGYRRTVRLRALNRAAYRDLAAEHPPRDDSALDQLQGLNMDTFPTAILSACAVEPTMTVEQVGQLETVVTDAQWSELFGGCMRVNRQDVTLPKSGTASKVLDRIGRTSKRPARGGSPGAGSSAGSLAS